MKKTYCLALAMAATSSLAFAGSHPGDSHWYVGGSFNMVKADWGDSFDLTALGGQAGYQLNDVVAFEVRGGQGVGDDSQSGLKLELNSYYGVYTKIGIPSNRDIYPYVVLGYTNIDIKATYAGGSGSDESDDVSYGVGMSANIDNMFDISLEYMRWFDKYSIQYKGVNIGANYRF